MEEIRSAIKEAVKKLFDADVDVELTRPDEQFGDYATNVAMKLGKELAKNPREIAQEIVNNLQHPGITKTEVAGPGFINLHLDDSMLWSAFRTVFITQPLSNKTIVIETNNPNPFKDMHIGHAYNSIVADTVANLLEAGGGEVHRVSYHGDVGLHVGKTMWAIMNFIGAEGGKLDELPNEDRSGFLSRMYQQGTAAYEEDDQAKIAIEKYAAESFTLEDPVFTEVYETCKGWSFAYFDSIFKQIGSKPIERRYLEREADAAGRKTVEDNIGKAFERSDGAIIFPGEKYGLHTRVFINSRGMTLYEARDLGLIQLKAADFRPDMSYIVTAVEQKEYFRVVFKAAELTLPELAGVTRNIPTGTVKLSSGKMSSRKGTFINIGWLIDEISKALASRSTNANTTNEAIIGALRYTMLKVRIGSDVIFDINEAISLDGNSGPYLQYAHARARSILSKAALQGATLQHTLQQEIPLQKGERSLLRKITEYPEAMDEAINELMPHHISTYLYELAQVFNSFYEHNRVIDDPRQVVRLKLVEAYAETLKKGLTLLNIPAPERM